MPEPAPKPPIHLGSAAFVTCTLIWGSTFLFISIGNDTVPPIWSAALRLGLASTVLFTTALVSRTPLPRSHALRASVLYGLFQFGINFPLLYWGETLVPSGLTAVMFATIPISTMFAARLLGLEPLSPVRVAGAVLALAGIAVIFAGEAVGTIRLVPMLAVLLATIAAVIGTMFFKKGPRQSAVAANAVASGVGCLVCLVLSTVAGERHVLPTSRAAVFAIVYLAIAGSVGAFVLWTWLVTHWKVTSLSFMAVISPLVAVALGTFVRHERLTPASVVGSAVVLTGVTIGLQVLRFGGPRRGPAAGR